MTMQERWAIVERGGDLHVEALPDGPHVCLVGRASWPSTRATAEDIVRTHNAGVALRAEDSAQAPTRPETGPMQFGEDWRGVFLSAGDAFSYARQLDAALDPRNSSEMRAVFLVQLRPLVALLDRGNEFVDGADAQRMRPFAEYVAKKSTTP